MKITLFITCFNDTLFPETGKAVVYLLERLGHTVEFPLEQTCCDQMHYNTGYQEEAIPMVQRDIKVFGDAEAIVAPSASCVAMSHEFYPIIARLTAGSHLHRKVESIRYGIFEVSKLLV